jgi:(1->4)-alpha-D-glucan 1-alpha-D-glucosylmutase
VQLNRGFTFRQAQAIVPYLRRLGVGALYASPVFKARPGSTHGYDILDYNTLNPELGGEADFHRFAAALRRHGLGLILDIVPNHMCVAHEENVWWNDVLRHGQASRYARMFDINWHPPQPELRNRIVLPILDAPPEELLCRGRIALEYREGEFWLRCRERRLPTDPATWPLVLECLHPRLSGTTPEEAESLRDLIAQLLALPSRDDPHPDSIAERHVQFEFCRNQLISLLQGQGAAATAWLDVITGLNDPRTGTAGVLWRLLEAQVYRLMYWPEGLSVLNYRRYADISDLAGVRQEHPDVFLASHERILELIGAGEVSGLRVDHPDGLLDPAGYFVRLQRGCALMEGALSEAGRGLEAPHGTLHRAFYVLAEKILSGDEPMRRDWPVHGTTGYEVLHLINGLFLRPEGEAPLRECYASFTACRADFHAVLLRSKREVLADLFLGELGRLTQRLAGILQSDPRAGRWDSATIQRALGEVIVAFPVYTHYLRRMGPPTEPEAAFVRFAVSQARSTNSDLPPDLFEQIQVLLLLEGADSLSPQEFVERQEFALRFRQILSAVMGKGLEDTALYRYMPLLSLNELGGDPAAFGIAPASFHRRMEDRQRHWPHGLSATSTHDTKRSEDVRARLNVLSELPHEWNAAVCRWWAWHQPLRRRVGSLLAPDANEAWLIYQTLVGAWPMEPELADGRFTGRVCRYIRKALREAKIHTRWIGPDKAYEHAVLSFISAILDPGTSGPFQEDFLAFHERIALAGAYNALAQVLLKCTLPGVPDLYQGCELWELSLVDPDNRRPVDFTRRAALLSELEAAAADDLGNLLPHLRRNWRDGRIKLYITWRALQTRHRLKDVMEHGTYLPLRLSGRRADHVVAFARAHGNRRIVTAVGRWFIALGAPGHHPLGTVWEDTRLLLPDAGAYRNTLTGETLFPRPDDGGWVLPLADAFAHLPLALLERVE